MVAVATGTAAAQDVGLCPPQAHGVPWQDGPPTWRDFTGVSPTACGTPGGIDCNHDDPRWRGAAAITYNSASGSANPPVQFRTVWAPNGGRAVYMQWLVRIAVSDTSSVARAQGHDIFFALERPNPSVLPAGDQRAWMVKMHLAPAGAITDDIPNVDGNQDVRHPAKCPSGGCNAAEDYFQVYQNLQGAAGAPGTATPPSAECGWMSGNAYTFNTFPLGDPDPDWLKNSIQYERICTGATQETCNLWVVSVRVPLLPEDSDAVTPGVQRAASLHMNGMEEVAGGTSVPNFWYHVEFSPWNDGSFPPTPIVAKLDGWPAMGPPPGPPAPPPPGSDLDTAGDPMCVDAGGTYYKDLDDDGGTIPKPWASVNLWDGFSARNTDCFDGITLTPDDVGALVRDFADPAPSDATILASPPWQTLFKAYNTTINPPPNTSPRARNTVFARPRNPTGAPITDVKLKARFRLAMWGAQPWGSSSPSAVWTDIPGSTDTGVCAASPSGGLCGNITIPSGAPPGNAGVVKLEWTIGGDDATITAAEALEFCVFGLAPPSTTTFTCLACTMPDGKPGTTVLDGGSPTGPACTRALWDHQCMLVELDSDSAATFENASVYQNMNIHGMSEVAREAMISVRGMPKIPSKLNEEIYLVVMPRNMPASLPPSTTGSSFVQANAQRARDQVMRPYAEAARQMDDDAYNRYSDIGWGGHQYGGGRIFGGNVGGEFIFPPQDQEFPQGDLPRGGAIMPPEQRAVAQFLDGASKWSPKAETFTNQMIDSLDNITATTVVPTLDVYAYRHEGGRRLVPLTSFTLVVHHDGPLLGITWEIDGATRLAHNLFRVDIPVGHRRKINVRVMAKESENDKQRRGNENWPCTSSGGMCCRRPCDASEPDFAMGNGIPLLLVGVVLAGRPRRKRKSKE